MTALNSLVAEARAEVARTEASGEWFPRRLVSELADALQSSDARIQNALRISDTATYKEVAGQVAYERMIEALRGRPTP